MFSLAGLNPTQRAAAETTHGPLLILAGAGSGKTRTVTYRVAHMISNCDISPKEILAISFTNKAAGEMKERIAGILGKRQGRGLTVSTFHSLGLRILRSEIQLIGYQKKFTIYDTSDQIALLRTIMQKIVGEKNYDIKRFQGRISFLKNKGIDHENFYDSPYFNPDEPDDVMLEIVYKEYQERLLFYNAIDFDDILGLTLRVFRENPEIASKYSKTYKFIMVDEYQDTNPLQFELIRHLTMEHNNICVVGDDDQSIYGFRGADIKNILDFENIYEGCKVIKLEQNYRSTQPILSLANEVIKQNKNRKDKTMWTDNKEGITPKAWMAADTDHEAEIIIDEITRLQAEGCHLADIAVLVRSTMQFPPLEDQLKMSMIPYQILGGQKFYERKEVKDILAYMSLIYNKLDEISLRRILNVPNRGIGLKTLQGLLEIVEAEKNSLFRVIQKTSDDKPKLKDFCELIEQMNKIFEDKGLKEGVEDLIEKVNYKDFVRKSYKRQEQVDRRLQDIENFILSCERFEKYNPNATLSSFLEKMVLQDSQNNQDGDEDDDVRANEVRLMTLHSSKGLEFDNVFLVGFEEETLPHKRTISLGEDIGEERRLAYVGVTRARENLIMTYCKRRKIYGKDTPRHISRFLKGLEKHYVTIDRTTLAHIGTEEEQEQYKADFFGNLFESIED